VFCFDLREDDPETKNSSLKKQVMPMKKTHVCVNVVRCESTDGARASDAVD
jgi:hypothetical protein